ncbi:MAG: NAD-dependent epimerase/dehydratase family protein [Pseudomonadota bacterium]
MDDLQLILSKTPANVWPVLQGQHIFITGGTGFIGCWLLEAFIWANQQLGLALRLSVLTRRPEAFRAKAPHLAGHPIVNLVAGNVNDLSGISQPYGIIIHAATDVAKPGANARAVFDDIVNGTTQTLALATRSKASRYLLTSSGAVYGRQPAAIEHIREDYPGAPDTLDSGSAYAQGKRVSEWLVQCHADQHGLETRIARCFALLGPYLPLNAHFAAGNFIRDGLNGQAIKVSGDGTACRSYLYAADMTIWLLTILANGRTGQSYNLGSDTGITINELAGKVSDMVFGENKVELGARPIPDAAPHRYVPNNDKAKNELDLLEYTDLQSALRKTIDWVIQNREAPDHNLAG